jgi:filamentous hemagglutinin
MWRINKQFLDNQLAQGKKIRLSHNPNLARERSFFARELEYLVMKQYEFKPNKDGYWYAVKKN